MILKLLILIILVIILVFYNLNLFSCNIENFESKNNDILVLIFSCKKYERFRIDILKK